MPEVSEKFAAQMMDNRSYLAVGNYPAVDIIETVVQVGVYPLLVSCGVTFNVINMVVFFRQGLADHINLCLFSLAVCDTGYMMLMAAHKFYGALFLIERSLGEFWKIQGYYLGGLYVAFLNTSNCLTLLISLERCICVVWPLKAKAIITNRRIQVMIIFSFVICFASNLTMCSKFDVLRYQDPSTNATRYRFTPTPFYLRHRYVIDFIFDYVNIFIPTTSLTVVTTATIIIAVRMHSVLTWRKTTAQASIMTLSEKDRREASMTRILVLVCVIYALCTMPYVTHAFFRFLYPGFQPQGKHREQFHVTVSLMNVILCVNSSANFVIYVNMSTRFKNTLKSIVTCKRASDRQKEAVNAMPVNR